MNKLITVYEHNPLEATFNPRELNQLQKMMKENKCTYFQPDWKKIRAHKYVGFIKVGDKNIQVLPKILRSKNGDEEENKKLNLKFLLYMLKLTEKIKVKNAFISNFANYENDLLEIFIHIFANNLLELLRRDFRRDYNYVEDNSSFLKGKILVSKNILHNGRKSTKFYCGYEVFTEDHILNQTLKYTSHLLLSISSSHNNKKSLQNILNLLANIKLLPITRAMLEVITYNRLNNHYRPVIELCKIILENSSVDLRLGKLETFSFMFDMSKLFEEFIFQVLNRNKAKLNINSIRAQSYLGTIFNSFQMKYDILVNINNKDIIIDTKYKTPGNKNKKGIEQNDLYQMFTYSQSQATKYNHIILLYPKVTMTQKNYTHKMGDYSIKLDIRHVDLQKIVWDKNLRRFNDEEFVNELGSCLPK